MQDPQRPAFQETVPVCNVSVIPRFLHTIFQNQFTTFVNVCFYFGVNFKGAVTGSSLHIHKEIREWMRIEQNWFQFSSVCQGRLYFLTAVALSIHENTVKKNFKKLMYFLISSNIGVYSYIKVSLCKCCVHGNFKFCPLRRPDMMEVWLR